MILLFISDMLVIVKSRMKFIRVNSTIDSKQVSALELSKYLTSSGKFHISEYHLIFIEKFSTCQTALGMQSGSISDAAISASSTYDPNTVGPKASR